MNSYEGRKKCEKLREMRKAFAQANQIPYDFPECTHEGPCAGTCPFCEQEAAVLERLAERMQLQGSHEAIYPQVEICQEESMRYVPRGPEIPTPPMVQGMMRPPMPPTMGLVVSPERDTEEAEMPKNTTSHEDEPEIKIPGFLRKNRRKS